MDKEKIDGRRRKLNAILVTIECMRAGVAAPRVLLARGYTFIYMVLIYALIPADWGLARFITAVTVGFGAYEFLKKYGPGRASWWTRLSDQLWSYEPRDRKALEQLRRELVEKASQGKGKALARVERWARAERSAISSATR